MAYSSPLSRHPEMSNQFIAEVQEQFATESLFEKIQKIKQTAKDLTLYTLERLADLTDEKNYPRAHCSLSILDQFDDSARDHPQLRRKVGQAVQRFVQCHCFEMYLFPEDDPPERHQQIVSICHRLQYLPPPMGMRDYDPSGFLTQFAHSSFNTSCRIEMVRSLTEHQQTPRVRPIKPIEPSSVPTVDSPLRKISDLLDRLPFQRHKPYWMAHFVQTVSDYQSHVLPLFGSHQGPFCEDLEGKVITVLLKSPKAEKSLKAYALFSSEGGLVRYIQCAYPWGMGAEFRAQYEHQYFHITRIALKESYRPYRASALAVLLWKYRYGIHDELLDEEIKYTVEFFKFFGMERLVSEDLRFERKRFNGSQPVEIKQDEVVSAIKELAFAFLKSLKSKEAFSHLQLFFSEFDKELDSLDIFYQSLLRHLLQGRKESQRYVAYSEILSLNDQCAQEFGRGFPEDLYLDEALDTFHDEIVMHAQEGQPSRAYEALNGIKQYYALVQLFKKLQKTLQLPPQDMSLYTRSRICMIMSVHLEKSSVKHLPHGLKMIVEDCRNLLEIPLLFVALKRARLNRMPSIRMYFFAWALYTRATSDPKKLQSCIVSSISTQWELDHPIVRLTRNVLNELRDGAFLSRRNAPDRLPMPTIDQLFSDALSSFTPQPYSGMSIQNLNSYLHSLGNPQEEHRSIFAVLSTEYKADDIPEMFLKDNPCRDVLLSVPLRNGTRLSECLRERRFQISLQHLLVEKAPTTGAVVRFALPNMPNGYLAPEVMERVFTEAGEWKIDRQTRITIGESKWELDPRPKNPLIEFAVHNFTRRFMGAGTPCTRLALVEIVGKEKARVYPILMREAIDAKRWHLEELHELDNYQHTMLCLRDILLQPGNRGVQDYWRDSRGYLHSMDNQVAFIHPSAREQPGSDWKLFGSYMEIISRKLDLDAVHDFLELSPKMLVQLLRSWMEDVRSRHVEYRALLEGINMNDLDRSFSISIPFMCGLEAAIYQKCLALQQLLRMSGQELTYGKLLKSSVNRLPIDENYLD